MTALHTTNPVQRLRKPKPGSMRDFLTWPEVEHKRAARLVHRVFYFPQAYFGHAHDAVLVGEIALVEQFEPLAPKVDVTRYPLVLPKGPSDVVNLNAFVVALRVRHEQDSGRLFRLRRQIDQLPVRVTPNGVEFRLDHHFAPLPNGPAHQCFTAVDSHMLFDDGETFRRWCIGKGLVPDPFRAPTGHDVFAEPANVRLGNIRHLHK
ncbi:hypothetical protein [Chromohalobacter israelensis]|uniref:hypothetical protein n=1 Tax=Chromohalobacter israelensis TaxID=141390 RepID=UPI001CC3740E|nr:hypothetical protein [Chromohalobacter salexigens]MBZ5875992.1 hypothetical protein [Chromohalobacter salexigens]